MKKIALLCIIAIIAIGCNNDDDCSCSTPENVAVTFNFTQNWEGEGVTKDNFNSNIYTNEFGNFLTISRLRYLISRIQLHKADGTTINFDDYQLVDLEDEASLSLMPALTIPHGEYSGISFVYGFNEEDNINGEYQDLNDANWNWPSMLGGGYHFMQMEGSFDDVNGDPMPYAYHNGTARVTEGEFEQNFVVVDLDKDFTVNDDTSIEIKMDIAEWYVNPYTWDLNVFSSGLMMNYLAQKHMQENAATVFSLGNID